MLDIMELRRFKVVDDVRGPYLVTPDGFHFAVMRFPHLSDIACIFACFESINSNYK